MIGSRTGLPVGTEGPPSETLSRSAADQGTFSSRPARPRLHHQYDGWSMLSPGGRATQVRNVTTRLLAGTGSPSQCATLTLWPMITIQPNPEELRSASRGAVTCTSPFLGEPS